MKLSLITPAKNVDSYLLYATKYFLNNKPESTEFIIVLDKFEPAYLFKELKKIEEINSCLKILQNNKIGRVSALNYGYKESLGEIIKCVDSDDILLTEYFNEIDKLQNYDAHCHNAIIGDRNLKKMHSYTFNPTILNKNYEYIVNNMISSPRWTWSFKRKIGNIIFPIPSNLFAEDFWFTFIIKLNSNSILHLNKELYIYRQHGENEWGGVVNFSKEVVIQRSKWLLNEINQLRKHRDILKLNHNSISEATIFHSSVLKNINLHKILFLKIKIIFKLKLILITYMPILSSFIIRAKWLIDKKRF